MSATARTSIQKPSFSAWARHYQAAVAAGIAGGSVTLAGKDYLTLSGQEITANSVDLTDDVTGILPLTNGGTGSATQNFIDLTTAQTAAGIKTFSASPIVPTPTTDYQASTKKYVDDNSGVGGTGSIITNNATITASTGSTITPATHGMSAFTGWTFLDSAGTEFNPDSSGLVAGNFVWSHFTAITGIIVFMGTAL